MKTIALLIATIYCSMFSFLKHDFLDYWTVKINGVEKYSSANDKATFPRFEYEVTSKSINAKDSIEVEYFTDSPCAYCIHNYFISEFKMENGKTSNGLKNYLNEQKSLGPKSYKLSLLDLRSSGNVNNAKAIFYYKNSTEATLLAVFIFK